VRAGESLDGAQQQLATAVGGRGALVQDQRRVTIDPESRTQAAGAARRVFPRLSVDLIYALPGQSIADWLVARDANPAGEA